MELYNNDNLQEIGETLLANNETIAVAESVTSGAIQLGMSNIRNASHFFQGGITTYNLAQKFHHLQVEPDHARQVNCVSQQVAVEMAIHVARSFSANWGIAITGYAVPAAESGNRVFAFYAICKNGEVTSTGEICPEQDEPLELQLYYANKVLSELHRIIRKNQ